MQTDLIGEKIFFTVPAGEGARRYRTGVIRGLFAEPAHPGYRPQLMIIIQADEEGLLTRPLVDVSLRDPS